MFIRVVIVLSILVSLNPYTLAKDFDVNLNGDDFFNLDVSGISVGDTLDIKLDKLNAKYRFTNGSQTYSLQPSIRALIHDRFCQQRVQNLIAARIKGLFLQN